MKSSLSGALALVALLVSMAPIKGAETNVVARDVLSFRNGDLLLGHLELVQSNKVVRWNRTDIANPIEFSGTNLAEARFGSVRPTPPSSTNGTRVHLVNGDSLEGQLTEIDAERIALETSYAGQVIFPRSSVARVESLPQEGQAIFAGPKGLEGWIMGKVTVPALTDTGDWRYTNGAFYATRSASIARDLKLPDVARIEFDLAWKNTLQAAVAIYTSYMQPINLANKDTEPNFGGFYSLQLNSFMASLLPVKKNSPLLYLGQMHVPAFSQKNRAHFELLASKPDSRIVLLVDGVLVKEWVDPDGFAGSGTGMRFVHQGQGAVRLSNIRISEWNGKIGQKPTNAPPVTEDTAYLLNGDKVGGKLENFSDGKLVFATSGRKLEVPYARVSEVELPRAVANARPTNMVRAHFPGGGSATMHLEKWDATGVTASSPHFGRVTFAPGTFERVEFYPGTRQAAVKPSVPSNLLDR